MIRYNYSNLLCAAFLGLALSFGACSSADEPWDEPENTQEQTPAKKQVKMNFEGSLQKFDQPASETRATTGWKEGDMIYIAFHKGSTIIPSVGVYGPEGWSVEFGDHLNVGTDQVCEIRYFENPSFANETKVELDLQSIIYEDATAKFDYDGEVLTVKGNLTPKVGRVRFSGDEGEKIYVIGTSSYTSFSPNTNTFFTSDDQITTTVEADGYTPYIYGYFTDSEKPTIAVIGKDYAYTRDCTSSMLRAGASGYMAIPTKNAHNKWREGLYLSIKGTNQYYSSTTSSYHYRVELKMIPVVGHSSGFFLMSETEVTGNLYYANISSNSWSNYNNSPQLVTYSDKEAFITRLNSTTHLNFASPTRSQWQYAAKGGALTQGYTYAGSNTIDDVAWYQGNASAVQVVKQRTSNELGLYDMSGNAAEWTADKFSTTSNYYVCGGDYASAAEDCTTTSTATLSSTSTAGIRLILTCE